MPALFFGLIPQSIQENAITPDQPHQWLIEEQSLVGLMVDSLLTTHHHLADHLNVRDI